jgi:hypothetical protein
VAKATAKEVREEEDVEFKSYVVSRLPGKAFL